LNNGPIEYRHEVQLLRGYAAYPVDRANINPISVLVLPDGLGLGEAAKTRARMLAQAGHIALAADLYGDGMLARDVAQGHALTGSH
jgi:dienelactone hydrolase